MSSSSLHKMKPLNVELIPPTDAEFYGRTSRGLPIYKQTMIRAGAAEPVPDTTQPKNEDGTYPQMWRKHPTTGQALYPMWRKKAVTIVRLIVPNQEGNGNLSWDEYQEPTPAEIAAVQREKDVAAMTQKLAGVLVDKGVDPETLVAALTGPKDVPAPVVAEVAPTPAFVVQTPRGPEPPIFPRNYAPGRYYLSDGTKFQGKKDEADKAEADVVKRAAEAKAALAGMPEE